MHVKAHKTFEKVSNDAYTIIVYILSSKNLNYIHTVKARFRRALIRGHLSQTDSFSVTKFLDMNSHKKCILISEHSIGRTRTTKFPRNALTTGHKALKRDNSFGSYR